MNNLKCCINDKVNNFEGSEYIDAGDCHLSLALAQIEALLAALQTANWRSGRIPGDEVSAAQAFLDEVKKA